MQVNESRRIVVLPHGTGKSVRILAITQGENINKALEAGADYAGAEVIKKSNKVG